MLHTGLFSEAAPPVYDLDGAERLRRLEAVCRRDLSMLTGLDGTAIGRGVLDLVLGPRVRGFARAMATFNADLDQYGLATASRTVCARYGGQVVAEGTEHVPADG